MTATIKELRSALTDMLDEGFNNHGDCNFVEHGGTQIKFDPDWDEFTSAMVYTPADTETDWSVTETVFDLTDLVYSVHKDDDNRTLRDDTPLLSLKLKDVAVGCGNYVGLDSDWLQDHLNEAIHLNEEPSAEYIAEKLINIVWGAPTYGVGSRDHFVVHELPEDMDWLDEDFDLEEMKAERKLMDRGYDFDPTYSHLTDEQCDELADMLDAYKRGVEDIANRLRRASRSLREHRDEPMARYHAELSAKQLRNVAGRLDEVVDRTWLD